jgi:F420-dependent oxidoreductase-like protein
MIELAIMLEGQNGVTWDRFRRIAALAEDLGFAGLYRSDHFTNASPPDKDSLELWVSLTWLASHTTRIEFGPLVTPTSFRDPVFTARLGKDVDDLSGGRLHLGVGAGWQEREHSKFGYDLLDLDGRFARFEEGLEVITRLLRQDGPVTFAGEFYRLSEAALLPRPQRPGGPPILIGGNGLRRTLPLVARYADMWNAIFLTPAAFREHSQALDDLLRARGRQPGDVHHSMMTGLWFGRDAAIQQRLDAHPRLKTRQQVREAGVIVGDVSEVVDQLGELEQAGVQRIMLQWLDLDDLAGLERLGRDVLPRLA